MSHSPDRERWVCGMKWHVKNGATCEYWIHFFLKSFRVGKKKGWKTQYKFRHTAFWLMSLCSHVTVLQGGGGGQKMIYSFILSNSSYMTQLFSHPRRIPQAHLPSAMVTGFPVIFLFAPSIFRSWKTSCGASPQRRCPHSCHRSPYTC